MKRRTATTWRWLLQTARRLHEGERGDLLEYLMILAAIVLAMVPLSTFMLRVAVDFYDMVAWHVSWPFL